MPNIGRPTSTNQPVPSMTSGMQSGNQHSMASQGNPQNQQAPSQGQSDPSAMLSPAGGPMQMAFPAMMPQQQPQYQIMVNQQGQQVLMPVGGFAGQMAVMPSQGAQPTNTGTYVIMPKGAGQQPQMIGTPTAAATQTPQGQAGGAKYTLTSTGIVPNAASAAPQNIIFQSMGGSPTVQPANPGMMPNTSHPSHVKTEAGKQQQHQIQSNQTATSAGGQQTQQQMTAAPPQPQMILPPGMTFVNPAQTMTGQPQATAYMGQNGQIYMAVNKAQDAGQAASQLVFSTPQGLQMQPHPQALQPNLNQPMPPGLNTSMTPMAMTSTAASSGNNMVRTTFTTNQHAPTGKTQISRAPPTLLPATTSSMITTTSRPTTTTTSFLPSPKSKQKMSPKGPPPHNKTNLPPKNILNTIKNNSNTSNSVSPPVLTTSNGSPITIGPPGSPFSVGPPVLQTSLAIPPPMSTAHSQPPTLHPMNSPMMIPTSVQGNIGGQYYNMSKSSPMAPSSLTNIGSLKPTESAAMTSTPKPIIPANNKKVPGNIRGEATIAAPMEQVGKPMTTTTAEVNGKSEVKSLTKTPTEILTHVIDGNVIQESSQPFPVDATEGKFKIRNNFPINYRVYLYIYNLGRGQVSYIMQYTAVDMQVSMYRYLSMLIRYTFSSNFNVHKSLCGHCFSGLRPLD